MVRGDVVVNVVVRPDGSVASAAVDSGEPLLRDVALRAAQQAQYECRGCTEVGTPYSLVFTFRIVGRDEPKPATGLTFDREGRATVNVVGVIGYWWEDSPGQLLVSRPSEESRGYAIAGCSSAQRCGRSRDRRRRLTLTGFRSLRCLPRFATTRKASRIIGSALCAERQGQGQ
jgi:hypothetical protein